MNTPSKASTKAIHFFTDIQGVANPFGVGFNPDALDWVIAATLVIQEGCSLLVLLDRQWALPPSLPPRLGCARFAILPMSDHMPSRISA